jgi:pSer/pThr/pTyr-binding forkhead associated (FHA) protein
MDTFETWDLLQQDCLLLRSERQEAQPVQRESTLIKRLREKQRLAEESPPLESSAANSEMGLKAVTPLPSPRVPVDPPPSQTPATLRAQSQAVTLACGMTVSASGRLIRLPEQGDVVFGRFEHGFSSPPDIDLALEDGEIPSVSRRHALVIGRGGRHWIEDMGSSNGTYVNGRRIPLGNTVQLSPGDRVLMGRCRLRYDSLPGWASDPDPREPHVASLFVTHTGHSIELPDKSQMMVGRPDPDVGYIPDADLSVAGEIAMYVSRRHARIIRRGGWHYLEEMGSAAGTRLNGKLIQLGEMPVMLRPGDHIWLGGCVVAYEWTLS